ncbi:hypothetical protein EMIHUDRAFT_214982 [Emiliania huxleyi CCMP1516]|uniref:Secreted protein n=2 Tax=Emiliania huxleyi TaxID=2903 RepID=A0A0D3IIQ7_EMIH1|nr:hypothetical protein EMIHUDRAFT_214982 [Emiliania huxleyi CCMP1516]EOD11142.1 hypothetical protein EMIHUDRAFT_214982 [Emiliania huxleyi CCMP1516]|eukprot:XP_005763571.1 hypothetical protein EMIHUDRAFT_214982 [Emiliania huxleyi CCMP1516]
MVRNSRYTILILVICAIWYLSVPSRGSCDPAEWTGAHGRKRGGFRWEQHGAPLDARFQEISVSE